MTSPVRPDAFVDATWDDIQPHYLELRGRALDLTNVEQWLSDWSGLDDLIYEAYARAEFSYTCDVADQVKEAATLRFASEIWPRVQEQDVALAGRLLDLGYSRSGLETMLLRFANQRDIFREANVPIQGQLEGLQSKYQKVAGALTVVWEDREIPVPQLLPHLESQDRQTRERAWRTYFSPYISKRDELADIFDELVRLRGSVALNAGFENYRDYAHREKNRFDYTPADCVRWQDSVEQVVVPAVVELRARRRSAMGLESLRPWDLDNDPYGHTPLRPFEDIAGLTGGVARIFSELEPSLAAEFQIMIDEGLLDLGSRKGKAPGGYCNSYPASRRPIIFMNAAGVHGDVKTLLHEAGHAFHCFEWFNIQPSFQRHPGSEMCEVASMTMELLAGPYLARDRGGFYTEEEAGRARADHLEEVLTILTHIAAVDGIQQWIYTNPAGADRDAREAEWIRLRERFDQGVDWSGLRPQRVARWYSQPHFFINPFYYIEYGLAQLAAVQIWRKSLEDPAGTLAGYRRALALGATKSLPELYAAAGAKLVFDPDEMGALVEFVQEQIAAAG